MEEIKIDDLMDVIEFKNASVSENTKREGSIEDDELRIYVPPRGSRKRKGLLRFIIMTCVFFLLFLCLVMIFKDRQADPGENDSAFIPTVMTPETNTQEATSELIQKPVITPVVIDESKRGIELRLDEEYSLFNLLRASEGVKVLIIHSHNTENVTDSLSVSDAGEVISQLLNSAGIEAYHCKTDHDADGNIGAYARMKESLTSLIEQYPDTVCVIDIHDSDSGLPVTFTVGTDSAGWDENLRFAEAICGRMTEIGTAFRFLPGTLGQDSGILTLNIGIGGNDCSEEDARTAIASFAEAFIKICNEKASAP